MKHTRSVRHRIATLLGVMALHACGGHSTGGSDNAGFVGPSGSDPCASNTTCSSCTAQSSCGYCGGSCFTGNTSGPTQGSCGTAVWAWTTSQCTATQPTNPTLTCPDPYLRGCSTGAECCTGYCGRSSSGDHMLHCTLHCASDADCAASSVWHGGHGCNAQTGNCFQ